VWIMGWRSFARKEDSHVADIILPLGDIKLAVVCSYGCSMSRKSSWATHAYFARG
jgi:hypothetical protein